jgi:hypothetical protein
MTPQIIIGHSTSIPAMSGSGWVGFGGAHFFTSGEAKCQTPWSVAGTLRNLTMRAKVAPGSGKDTQFLVYLNGVATSMTVTIADTDTIASDSASFAIAPGDLLSMEIINTGTPASPGTDGYSYSVQFDPDVDGMSCYTRQPLHLSAGAITAWNGIFWPCTGAFDQWNTTAGKSDNIVSVAGAVTRIDTYADVAPGVGDGYDIRAYLNGVVAHTGRGRGRSCLQRSGCHGDAEWAGVGRLLCLHGDDSRRVHDWRMVWRHQQFR